MIFRTLFVSVLAVFAITISHANSINANPEMDRRLADLLTVLNLEGYSSSESSFDYIPMSESKCEHIKMEWSPYENSENATALALYKSSVETRRNAPAECTPNETLNLIRVSQMYEADVKSSKALDQIYNVSRRKLMVQGYKKSGSRSGDSTNRGCRIPGWENYETFMRGDSDDVYESITLRKEGCGSFTYSVEIYGSSKY